jgi:hypothetical protein
LTQTARSRRIVEDAALVRLDRRLIVLLECDPACGQLGDQASPPFPNGTGWGFTIDQTVGAVCLVVGNVIHRCISDQAIGATNTVVDGEPATRAPLGDPADSAGGPG